MSLKDLLSSSTGRIALLILRTVCLLKDILLLSTVKAQMGQYHRHPTGCHGPRRAVYLQLLRTVSPANTLNLSILPKQAIRRNNRLHTRT